MRNVPAMPATYHWLCTALNMPHFILNSMGRAGAYALAEADISLQDLQELGDWKSMQVLMYLEWSASSRVSLDRHMTKALFG